MALFKSLCAPKKHTINFYHTSNWTTVPVIDNVYGFKTGQTLLVLQYTNYMLKSFKLCYLEVCRAEIFLKAVILLIKYIMFMKLNYVKNDHICWEFQLIWTYLWYLRYQHLTVLQNLLYTWKFSPSKLAVSKQ